MASRKPLWIVGGVIAGLIAIFVIGAMIIFASIDSIIKEVVESVGPKMTQTEVKLDKVELSTTSGTGKLSGLMIGNPKGFTAPSAMQLGEVGVTLDIATLAQDTIVIKSILIRAPQITYEYGPTGGNIETIKKNVDSYVGQTSSSAAPASSTPGAKSAPAPEKKAPKEEGGKKLIIEDLRIVDAKVTAAAMGQQMTQGLPAIQLKDIGKSKGGATPAEVVEQILAALQQQVARAAQSMGADKLKDAAKGALENATKGGVPGGDTTKGATDTIKGLFGK
ncbi:MAG: hypothetical protein K0Q70_2427 [Rhodospirillales bacterium]|jgi:hypothetical protein|nr:hypothetical protein [Rhodospirillales bacterium]